MRKLVKTPREYVRRLRQTLNREDACACCPLMVGFIIKENSVFSNEENQCTLKTRGWCRDFVGLDNNRGHNDYVGPSCPCQITTEAPTLARKALALWDKGEHPWQRG